MNQKKISIIIPIYNVEKYLDKCLCSITNQSYSNIELILVDDGSTDSSSWICDKYSEIDNRVYVIHQKNVGVSAARNVGLEHSSGDYITFVDPDDYINTDMYSIMINALESKGVDAVCSMYFLENNGEQKTKKSKSSILHGINAFENMLYQDYYTTSVWNKLFKRQCIIKESGTILFPVGVVVGEDQLWLYNVCLQNDLSMYFISEPLYHWVIRNNSAIRRKESIITNHDRCSVQVCDYVIEKALSSRRKSFIKIAYVKKYAVLLGIIKDKYKSSMPELDEWYNELRKLRNIYISYNISKFQMKNVIRSIYWEFRLFLICKRKK